jgi:hypothetical protein
MHASLEKMQIGIVLGSLMHVQGRQPAWALVNLRRKRDGDLIHVRLHQERAGGIRSPPEVGLTVESLFLKRPADGRPGKGLKMERFFR